MDKSLYSVYLDHAVRHWQAEEENARRLANRVNLQLFVIAGFLGLGFFQFFTGDTRASDLVTWVVFAGFVLLGLAALLLLRVIRIEPSAETLELFQEGEDEAEGAAMRRPPHLPASFRLRIPEHLLETLPPSHGGNNLEDAQMNTFVLTLDAAFNLGEQNANEERRIDVAQQVILIGFLFIVVGISIYLLQGPQPVPQPVASTPQPAITAPEGPEGE